MFSKNIFGIVYYIVLGIFLIPIFFVISQTDVNYIVNWESVKETYYDRLFLSTQAVLGLIIIMTIFYLGKIHDYRKELVIGEVNLREVTWKFKKKIPRLNWQVDKKTFELSENIEDIFQEIERTLQKVPIAILLILIIQLLLIGAIFVMITTNEIEGNQKSFILTGLLLSIVICELFVVWALYEHLLSLHRNVLRSVLYGKFELKKFID